MLRIDPVELANRFQRPGGVDWVAFMDALLWAACWQVGIPESAVRTNLRTDMPDGGVDTRVSQNSDRDVTGYLKCQSIWQYKSAHESNLSPTELVGEVNKPYAKERIAAGDAYRLCLAVQMADPKRTSLEEEVSKAARTINPDAPDACVLTVDIVAQMASHFPNLLHEYRGLEFQSRTFTFSAWGKNITARTPTFVAGPSFAALKEGVLAFVDPTSVPARPLLSVYGMASIGKTRSVYEALKRVHAAESLVLYADDAQQAVDFARILANNEQMQGVLVVDDTSFETRHRLSEALYGHKQRIRVIAIQQDSEKGESELPDPEALLYTQEDIGPILQENFREVAPERLRAYVELSEEYLRFAIDLCQRDHQIGSGQDNLLPTLPEVMDYYRDLLGPDVDFVDALALFTRVGRDEDVAKELNALCKWRGFDRRVLEQRCTELKETPGFVERSAIYYRIRPAIIAKHAFTRAWTKWVEGREQGFLTWVQSLSKDMQVSFLARVQRSAGGRERQIVRDFFQDFTSRLKGSDLSDAEKIPRLVALVEIDPDHYLPQLRFLVEKASDKEIGVERRVNFGWGPRRQLVFAATEMTQFAAYFGDAERILFRLSQVEIEPNIGNNASGEWERLFRPLLSGTSIPFADRIALLRKRLPSPAKDLTPQCLRALEKTFDYMGSGTRRPPVVAGRIPERQWRFRTEAEKNECVLACLQLLWDTVRARLASADAHATNRLLIDATEMFVRSGFLEIVESEIRPAQLPEKVRAELHTRLHNFATRSGIYRGVSREVLPDAYAAQICLWLESFHPTTLLGRIIQAAGQLSLWEENLNEPGRSLSPLAAEFLESHNAHREEAREVLDWAYSENVHGAFQLGFQIGKADTSGSLLSLVIDRAVQSGRTEFSRGYLPGSLLQGSLNIARTNELLDKAGRAQPRTAFSLAQSVADVSDAFGRALEMVRTESLTPADLKNFTVWVGTHRTTPAYARRALEVLMPMMARGKRGVAEIAVDFVAYQYTRSHDPDWTATRDSTFDELAWRVLEEAIDTPDLHGHWWGETLKALAKTAEPLRVARTMVRAMSGSFHLRQEADKLLGEFAETNPEIAMEALGEMMQDEEMAVHLHIERLSSFLALPPSVLGGWLDQHGVDGAMIVAHHIPAPQTDDDGVPVLHPLTELFLAKYADDERVFNEYVGHLHSLQVYTGDIAQLKEGEANVARKFLIHELPRVRDWASLEIKDATREAARFRALRDKQKT
jgi:hypothetical protein